MILRCALLFLLPLLTSCSVMMAANKTGSSVETIQKALTREELIACGASLISSEEEGDARIDLFKVPKEHGSITRAAVNGLLDLGTGFLWEFAGTPIEIALDKDSFHLIKVTFDSEEQIQQIEIL